MALFKILKGQEKNLPANKTEGWAYVTTDEGNMYVDVSASKRVRIGAHADKADVATKAEGDTKPIREIYLAKLKQVTSDGTTFSFRGETGNGTDAPDLISIPLAGDKAGLISNAAQTIKGNKTFADGISFPTIATWPTPSTETYPIKSQGLSWSGSSDNAAIFYEVQASDKGMLVIESGDDGNAGLEIRNSASKKKVTIVDGRFIGDLTGTADYANKAQGDSQTIRSKYVSSVVKKSGSNYIFTVTKGDGTTNDIDLYFAASGSCGGSALSADLINGTPITTLPTGDPGTGKIKYYYNTYYNATGNMPATDNANGILQISRHNGNYDSQLGFSSNGNIYYRSFSNAVIDTTKPWKQIAFTDGKIKNAEFADKATGDTTSIRSTYIHKIKQVTSDGTTFTFRGEYGDGSNANDLITIPAASSSIAGLVTNAAQTIAGEKTFNNNLFFSNITGATGNTGTSLKGVYGQIGDNDGWRIAGGSTASNAGFLEIAVCDDGTEPIYVRQYNGAGNYKGFVSVARTLTLLDENGNTRIPGSLYDKNNQELRANLFLASLFTKTSTGTQLTIGGKNTAGTELSTITIPNASETIAGIITNTDQSFDGTKRFNKALTLGAWATTIKCATWSRICYISAYEIVSGAAYIIKVQATRGNVVYNNTYSISASHPSRGAISCLSGTQYSGLQVRLLVDSSGNSYFEIYDTAHSATSDTTQVVYCSIVGIATGGITKYTSFTDGSTLPSGFSVADSMTTAGNRGGLQSKYITTDDLLTRTFKATGGIYDKNGHELLASLYVSTIETKVSTGTEFTLRGLNTAGSEITALTIPNASTSLAGLITNSDQSIKGTKTLDDGMLIIKPVGRSSWNEGIRILDANNGWTTLAMGGSATSGANASTWSMHTYQSNFYLAHNGSNSSSTGILQSDANGNWRIDNSLGIGGKNAAYKLYVNGTSYFTDLITTSYGASHKGILIGATYVNAIGGEVIFQNNTAIRFGADNWDYDKWAGLKYTASSKTISLGIADKTIFVANSAQTQGTLEIVQSHVRSNIDNIYDLGTTAVRWRNINLGTAIRQSNRSYPWIGSAAGSKYYKVTLPYNGVNGSANKWFMISMEITVGGPYSSGESGKIELSYYFVWDGTGKKWSANNVKGIAVGINMSTVKIYYDIVNPAIFYIYAGQDQYRGVQISNMLVHDSAPGYDFTQTKIETCADITVANFTSIPIVNLGISGTSLYTTSPIYININDTRYPILRWNKNGTYWGGIGYNGISNENYFGPCDAQGNWVARHDAERWRFLGALKIENYGHTLTVGNLNADWTHFETTCSKFYFNHPIAVDGDLYPYTNNNRNLGLSSNYWNKTRSQWIYANAAGSSTDGGITLYANGDTNYGIFFRGTGNMGTHGSVTADWATYFTMSNTTGRGWVFRNTGTGNVASISAQGHMTVNSSIGINGTNVGYKLYVNGTSWVHGTLWTGHIYPEANNAYECGNGSYYWSSMSTRWLHANRGGSNADGGITLYGTSPDYGIMFRGTSNQGAHGWVTSDWATYFTMNNQDNRGWIFRRYNSKNVFSIDTNGYVWADGSLRANAVGKDGFATYPRGGHYSTSTPSVTGYLRIQLPVYRSNTMMKFIVDIYNYADNTSVSYAISGYNYSDGVWYSCTAECLSHHGQNKQNLTVAFGEINSKSAVMIGAAGTVWDYPQVQIRDIVLGYSNWNYKYWNNADWVIDFSTSPIGNVTRSLSGTDNIKISRGQFDQLVVINDASNNEYNGLAYFRNYSNNDWTMIIDKNNAYDYGLDIRTSTNAAFGLRTNGQLIVNSTCSSYREGIRLRAADGTWNTIILGATADSGTNAYAWSIHRKNDNNFCISRNSSDGLNGLVLHQNGCMGLGTVSPGYRLHVNGNGCFENRIYAHEWIEFNGDRGLYWPNGGYHFYPCAGTSYGSFGLRGGRGGYHGITIGYDNNYMTVMDSGVHKGLYQTSQGMWMFYYNRDTQRVGIRTSSLTNYAVTCEGDFYCRNGWLRTQGTTGWFNESYNGGWYMTDATWVRSYASKSLYMGTGIMRTDAICGGMWITGTHDGAIQVRAATGAAAGNYFQSWFSGKTPSGAWGIGPLSGSNDMYFCFGTDANYNAGNNSTANIRFGSNGTVWGAVWNDYAEFRKSKSLDPGRVVIEDASGEMKLATERLQPGANIISDTYGFTIGETKENKTPIAVAGRVLAYTYEDRYSYPLGSAVCSGPNGTVSLMTREEIREYPERIIGTVSEIPEYETWGTDNVKVNGRIWIKVK